jgi:hypothetical protein
MLLPLNTITRLSCLLLIANLAACGGGGGGGGAPAPTPPLPNVAPVANGDSATLIINTPTVIDVLVNDTDGDGTVASLIVITNPANGSLSGISNSVTYTPNTGFTGADSFTYAAVDNRGGSSNTVTVTLTIDPITITTLAVTNLVVPTTGYTAQNNAALNATVLTSANQSFSIPPNPVSFALYLTGADVSNRNTDVLATSLIDPAGISLPNFNTQVSFCDIGFCGSLLPRREGQQASSGDWAYTLGTRASDLTTINFTDMRVQLAVRTGPEPDLMAAQPASLKVQPFKTSTSISDTQLNDVLNQFVAIANSNGIGIDLQPTTVLTQPEYAEVSSDFDDPTTTELVTLGAPDSINIFFIEAFSGAGGGGRLGISPGIPGTLGVKGPYNGILINATATVNAPSIYVRSTAEFAFHEMGHLLGLFHTTESNFSNDIIDDTPNCLMAVNDTNVTDLDSTIGVADLNECPDGLNPMFWTSDFNTPKQGLTATQRQVIYYSPIAR